jgi:hypothetical protein
MHVYMKHVSITYVYMYVCVYIDMFLEVCIYIRYIYTHNLDILSGILNIMPADMNTCMNAIHHEHRKKLSCESSPHNHVYIHALIHTQTPPE